MWSCSKSRWLLSEHLFVCAAPGCCCFTLTDTLHWLTWESQNNLYRFKKMVITKMIFHAGKKIHHCHIQSCITELSHWGLTGYAFCWSRLQGRDYGIGTQNLKKPQTTLPWKHSSSRTLTNCHNQIWDWNSSPVFASVPFVRSKITVCPA